MAKKPATKRFKAKDFIVYPAHGVGQVTGVEIEHIAGMDLEVYVVDFPQDKMTLRVPTARASTTGMRSLASSVVLENAIKTLKGKPKVKRTMWSRRAQEYEAKINSGDLIWIAEVVRDLHRNDDQPEQSYSERQLYESAIDRMAREVAAVKNIECEAAFDTLTETLVSKSVKAA